MKKSMLILVVLLFAVLSACGKTTATTTSGTTTTTATTQTTAATALQPDVTNGNGTVVDFNGYTVTKEELYNLMKQAGGLSVLLNYVDNTILSSYKDQIDTAALNAQITSDQASQGDAYYNNLISGGIILSQNDPNLNQEIENHYITPYLQKAYAESVAKAAISQSDIQTAVANYHEDTCIIPLEYSSSADAQAEETKLAGLSGDAVINEFASQYQLQQKAVTAADPISQPAETVAPFLSADSYSCGYYQAVYDNYSLSTAFRDFVFDNSFADGTYNTTPLSASVNYYVVYKVSTAPAKSTYDTTALSNYLENEMLSNTVTSSYITTQVEALRLKDQLKIYDSALSASYSMEDKNYQSPTAVNNTDVASFSPDGGATTVTVTADDLYNLLKPTYAVYLLINHINYYALNADAAKNNYALTASDIAAYQEEVTNLENQFMQNGYYQYISWDQYILLYYGASSNDDLAMIFSLQGLEKRYILGYGDYAGINPVTASELQTAYNNWFNYQASEIFFTFDPTNPASQDLAKLKANEIIHGCTQDEINSGTCYINYNGSPFTGLDNTSAGNLSTVFATLAENYSQDTGNASKGGDVGTFGPGVMTDDFTNAVKAILAANGGLPGGYSDAPVYDAVPVSSGSTVYGYHVIYVTGNTAKAPIPTTDLPSGVTADNIFEAGSVAKLASVTGDTNVVNFYQLVSSLQSSLNAQHTTSAYIEQQLALLRQAVHFSFNDDVIEQHYEAITNVETNSSN